MCGIVGIWMRDGASPVAVESLRAMNATLRHRGPDGSGEFLRAPVGLAMRRLSIIDLTTGDQPIANEDGSIQVVYNGEMYNYPALRGQLESRGHVFRTRSDTETIVHAYEEWGEAFLERLNGMFAFALWDERTQTLLVARDRTGIKPLYYTTTPRALLFASELKALRAHPDVVPALDLRALSYFLSLEYVPSPLSILQGVHKLRPGHFLRARAGEVTDIRYWDIDLGRGERALRSDPASSPPQGEGWGDGGSMRSRGASNGSKARSAQDGISLPAQFLETLRQAVGGEMLSDVPVGVLLSGGLDSSAIAALMAERAHEPVPSFSIAFSDKSFDESAHARHVAAHLGTQHHELTLTPAMMLDLIPQLGAHLDEPFADPSVIPTYLVARFAREHVKVVLGGDGGDEMLAGYSTLQAHRVAPMYRALPAWFRQGVVEPIVRRLPASSDYLALDFKLSRFVRGADRPAAVQHQMWTGALFGATKASVLAPDIRTEIGDDGFGAFVQRIAQDSGAHDPINRILYQDMKLYLEGDILTKVDRASMAVSLETRVPFLNAGVIDFLQAVPLRWKLRGLTRKYLLRRAMASQLPSEIIRRKKQGFTVPVARWINGELHDFTRALLDPRRLRQQGLFDPAGVQRLLDEHGARRANHAKSLWTLLMFQLWHENWMA